MAATCRRTALISYGGQLLLFGGQVHSRQRRSLVRVEDCQTGQGLKVARVAGNEGEAVSEGRGGSNGIGQLHAVLLAQADGVLGVTGSSSGSTATLCTKDCMVAYSAAGSVFVSSSMRVTTEMATVCRASCCSSQLLFEPGDTSRRQTTNYQVNNGVGIG